MKRLTKREAAAYLHVSPRTLDMWRAEDRGPRSHKVMGRVYWLKQDLDVWLATQLIETARGGIR